MSKKTHDSVPDYTNHTCDTCRHATYDMQHKNLSIHGKPTLIICALHPFPKIVVGTKACENYKQKTRT